MDRIFLEKAKRTLEEQKAALESRLAEVGEKTKDNFYTARFPNYGDDEESAVSEVEDYDTNVDVEKNLSRELRATEAALKRIDEGTYGYCTNCHMKIEKKRLRAYPAATLCLKCEKK